MNLGNFEIFSKRLLTVLASVILASAFIFSAIFGLRIISAQTAKTLTVNKIGLVSDGGTVTSDLPGINCGSTCSAAFNDGETVTLTVSIASGTFAVFEGWSGACSGAGNTCTVLMNEAKNVTAQFSESNYLDKCTVENPATWGLRYRLTGAAVTPTACRARCIAGGGNGYFAINAPLGWCVCGTARQPVSTQPETQGCNVLCPGTNFQCGGNIGQYSVYANIAPTAATASVSGRVLTSNGNGVANASVSLLDSVGNKSVARTSSLGYYYFDGIEVGQSVWIRVSSKNYEFEPRLINVNEDVSELNFVGKP